MTTFAITRIPTPELDYNLGGQFAWNYNKPKSGILFGGKRLATEHHIVALHPQNEKDHLEARLFKTGYKNKVLSTS